MKMSRSVSVSVAFGSPWMPFHTASVTGVVNSDGSITIRLVPNSQFRAPPRTHRVGATCQPQSTKQPIAFAEGAWRLPSIQTFAGSRPIATISRHISLARAQQPSYGNLNGMHGTGTVSGSQVVAAIASKIARAWVPFGQCHHHHG